MIIRLRSCHRSWFAASCVVALALVGSHASTVAGQAAQDSESSAMAQGRFEQIVAMRLDGNYDRAAEMANELAAALGLEQPASLAMEDPIVEPRGEEATEPVDLTDRAVSTER